MFEVSAISQVWARSFEQLLSRMDRQGDAVRAEKLQEMLAKLDDPAIEVAFCGHFSAGKSSLINTLCGSSLLPSSPIPTSANVVSIRSGAKRTTLHRKDGSIQRIQTEQLELYCKDGDDIEEIYIEHPLEGLGENIVLLDTPGIDSTDEAHQLATRSVLHRADAVFYVMDYNHVQSEINFTFVKSLIEQGKPVYCIVNQIDKHREHELSFNAYQEAVYAGFAAWGIEPAGVFFISLRNREHPHNEYNALFEFIQKLPQHSEVLKNKHALHAGRSLIDEHLQFLLEQQSSIREELQHRISETEQVDSKQRLLAEKQAQHAAVLQAAHQLRESMKREMEHLIDNANIIPAKTRDLAHAFLESSQAGFKSGWLFASARTAAEKARRAEEFTVDFAEQVHVQLQYHLVSLLKQICDQAGVASVDIQQRIDSISSPVSEAWLRSKVHSGAVLSGEYTLNYSRSISAEVKADYRRQGLSLLDAIIELYEHKQTQEAKALEAEINALSEEWSAVEELHRMDEELELIRKECSELLDVATENQSLPVPLRPKHESLARHERLDSRAQDELEEARERDPMQLSKGGKMDEGRRASVPLVKEDWKATMRQRLFSISNTLQTSAMLLKDIPALRSVVASLEDKASRLASSTFTIALFGAFSAGKSSFANALIGEAVLPVSPNPTTAVINRIVPPKEGWEHRTARIVMKQPTRLEEELRYSLDRIGVLVSTVEEALEAIQKLKAEHIPPNTRAHYSFLQAVAQGWSEERHRLGTEWKADFQTYREYAAVEAKSCFVEEIELYYASQLTDAGIELVDTPGADSINARHTGVAFNYIKNADAILFVTYYNHAFSQADREFLNQLGRVKESFQLDKMFFIINAADLASSEEELTEVTQHVATNLAQHSIRNPRIHALSSALALEAKAQGDHKGLEASRIGSFEKRFYPFIYEELSDMLVQAAVSDIERAKASLHLWIQEAKRGEAEKQEQAMQLRQAADRLAVLLQSCDIGQDEKKLRQEIHELIFYVNQRVSYRFGQLYQLAFNPASLRSDQSDISKALTAAWKELLSLLSYDLSQEMLAMTLRLDHYLKRLLAHRHESLVATIHGQLPDYIASALQVADSPTPPVDEELESQTIEAKTLLAHFRNAKHFFEGEGSERLKTLLEKELEHSIAQYSERHKERFVQHYSEILLKHAEMQLSELRNSLKEYAEGWVFALESTLDLPQMQEKCLKLEQLRGEL